MSYRQSSFSTYSLAEGLFLYPTPVGSYYAISSNEDNKSRKFLKRLLRQAKTPELTLETIKVLMDEANDEKALDLLHHKNLGHQQVTLYLFQ
jgi:hypothetical protein